MCVKPKKLKVSGLARFMRSTAAKRPNSITRVLSGWSDSAKASNRTRIASRKRRASHEARRWSWDLVRIQAKGYTDNVVDLMVRKLARLPPKTQKALQELACLGNAADLTTLAIVLRTSEDEVHAALLEASDSSWSSACQAPTGSFTTGCRKPPSR
jgi:hypothetical protein